VIVSLSGLSSSCFAVFLPAECLIPILFGVPELQLNVFIVILFDSYVSPEPLSRNNSPCDSILTDLVIQSLQDNIILDLRGHARISNPC
jgi:hypothetical protein